MAVTPSTTAQNKRCHTGERGSPREAIESTTYAPESAEVTKNTAINKIASHDTGPAHGRYSQKRNRSASTLPTVCASAPPAMCVSTQMAPLPKAVIHKRLKAVGTSSTPTTNSRMVRPREMRAMNMPTNGDHEIHHAQYKIVQPPNQPGSRVGSYAKVRSDSRARLDR